MELGVVVVVTGRQLFNVALVADLLKPVADDVGNLQGIVGRALTDQISQNFAL